MLKNSHSAAATGLPTRRALLAALPATALAPAALAAPVSDPHPAWFAEWERNCIESEVAASKPGAGDADTSECLALEARRVAIEDLLCTVRAETVAGALAQLEWVAAEQRHGIMFDGHMRALDLALTTLRTLTP